MEKKDEFVENKNPKKKKTYLLYIYPTFGNIGTYFLIFGCFYNLQFKFYNIICLIYIMILKINDLMIVVIKSINVADIRCRGLNLCQLRFFPSSSFHLHFRIINNIFFASFFVDNSLKSLNSCLF